MPEPASSATPIALVTGAGSGIGRAAAKRLGDGGTRVILVGRRHEPLAETAAIIHGPSAIMTADIGDANQAEALAERVASEFGRLDILVNNAGYAPLIPFHKTTVEAFEACFRANAIGPALLIARCWSMFAAQRSACIVNVSTVGTRDPFPGFAAYAASKAALNSLTRSCMNEGRDIGLRAFTVAPGAVETPMLRGLFDADTIPSSACIDPDDVASVIADCAEGRRDDAIGEIIWVEKPPA
ncbi:MAG: SDR family oxidoreductase [Planctomycetota bacterium]